jgi:cellulase
MKSATLALIAALSASRVAAHATFQELWINGVDQGQVCVRLPQSNSPLQDVTSNNIRCNVNNGAVAGRCAVKAGDTVSVEMHQQNGDRSCTLSSLTPEAIGGAHWGPVHAYMSKVSDARTADGSTPFFKIFANTWSPANNGAGDNDWWGVKDMQNCCGRGTQTQSNTMPSKQSQSH